VLERFKEQLEAIERERSRQDAELRTAEACIAAIAALGDITFAIPSDALDDIARACDVAPRQLLANANANALRA
jgi:hypothetical protein